MPHSAHMLSNFRLDVPPDGWLLDVGVHLAFYRCKAADCASLTVVRAVCKMQEPLQTIAEI